MKCWVLVLINAVWCKGHRRSHLKRVSHSRSLCGGAASLYGPLINPSPRPTCSLMAYMSMGNLHEHFTCLLYTCVQVYVERTCMWVFMAHVTPVLHSVMLSNVEPPVRASHRLPWELQWASAALQLNSRAVHSNLREWELQAPWTFFNNERILCLQCSTWLTHSALRCTAVQR